MMHGWNTELGYGKGRPPRTACSLKLNMAKINIKHVRVRKNQTKSGENHAQKNKKVFKSEGRKIII